MQFLRDAKCVLWIVVLWCTPELSAGKPLTGVPQEQTATATSEGQHIGSSKTTVVPTKMDPSNVVRAPPYSMLSGLLLPSWYCASANTTFLADNCSTTGMGSGCNGDAQEVGSFQANEDRTKSPCQP